MILRDLKPSDIETVCAIFKDIVLRITATFEETPPTLQNWTSYYDEKVRAGIPCLGLEVAGRVVRQSAFR